QLVEANGTSKAAAFWQITPEAYASARQISVESGLALAEAGRGAAFATDRNTPGAFAFGSAMGSQRTLAADSGLGTARARIEAFGVLGGLGWGSSDWSVGAFVGHSKTDQRLGALNAETDAKGMVGGIHGRLSSGGFGLKATVAYDDSDARTDRAMPVGPAANGRYSLRAWTADVAVDYSVPVSSGWAMRPSVGATLIKSIRGGLQEEGGSPLALTVARDRDTAAFADAKLAVFGGMQAAAKVQPYASIGVRYQLQGRGTTALASLDGGTFGLAADGASRARLVGTAALGAEAKLARNISLFGSANAETGLDDRRLSATAGIRVGF
ncbi:MAG TPA: autotransporter outer membrane beta-barrel domain-containing protein, partial [Sphingomicrobium sp.]